jgi:D-lactate dehydrogenase
VTGAAAGGHSQCVGIDSIDRAAVTGPRAYLLGSDWRTRAVSIAHGFGVRLFGWNVAENPACCDLGMRYVDRDTLFAESGLASLHVPLLPDTHHLVDAAALARMKDDAILINSSCGGMVDTDALIRTLLAGRLTSVGPDIYEEASMFFFDYFLEVMTDDRLARLMTSGNLLVTSHQAYYIRDAATQIMETTARNIADHLAGRLTDNAMTSSQFCP